MYPFVIMKVGYAYCLSYANHNTSSLSVTPRQQYSNNIRIAL